MKKKQKWQLCVLCGIILVAYPVYKYYEVIWKFMEKIGALATGLALFAAMYQGFVAWKAANLTREVNSQNLFQQKFNLVLEQHNNSLARVREWVKSNNYLDRSDKKLTTEWFVGEIRGHEQLSPYMRILYHTLKTIKEELPIIDKTDHLGEIKNQKRYTSLVRSFIPNDILFLVACNASVINDKVFNISNSESYSYYNTMLQDFDFFEHLQTSIDKKIILEEALKEVVHSTYESCYLYYLGFETIEKVNNKKSFHIDKLKTLLSNPDFFICLAYNLKNKAIDTTNFKEGMLSVKEMLTSYMCEHIEKLNKEELNDYISLKTNKSYEERITKIIREENVIYNSISTLSKSGTAGLYNAEKVIDYFKSTMRYDNPMIELLIFRDSFHPTLKSLILDTSCNFKSKTLYEYSVNKSYNEIIRKTSLLIDDLIKFRNKVDYSTLLTIVLKNKKEELLQVITNLSD